MACSWVLPRKINTRRGAALTYEKELDTKDEVVWTFPDIFGSETLIEAVERAGLGPVTGNTRELANDE